ncbi:hypothetical protein DFR52_11012 [Hoeflea marina]|uniref:CENP-V/GFA domain-containing protein n=1 Tax=Hoeflea marina TaxID=274592 RepID=A0A317PCL1_9HYPH|nr:GFA family protein [Hoeflea marina]PWV95484.1 hypothetical protein DFR52_11012 [Hoeflea marina]
MFRTAVPPLPITGACQCGRVRYRMRGAPLVFYLCHCTECQRQTSSAYGESLRFRRPDMEIEGELRLVERLSESGARRQGWFCPDCGVRIWHGSTASPEINIKAGTLNDTSWLVPAGHIWTRSRQRFIAFGEDELVYDRQPDDGYAALARRWREMTQV